MGRVSVKRWAPLRTGIFFTGILLLFGWLSVSAQEPVIVRLEIVDPETGSTLPSRVYLTDSAGTPLAPAGLIAYHKRNEHHFIAPGSLSVDLPPGRYVVSAERGPEYRPASVSFEVRPGRPRTVTLRLARWIRMNARGWYSGDLHNHRSPSEMPQLLAAEDLNLAPTLTDWIWEDRPAASPEPTDSPVRVVDALHVFSVLDKEIERLESGPGAVNLLGLKSVVPFEGYRLHPPNPRFCNAAREQGAYVDAEKIVWRDVAALVALGHVDFAGIVHNHFNRQDVELETDRWGMIPKDRPEYNTVAGMPLWSMDVYYRFLNCGFRLPVSAGSASGVKAAPLGYNRVYVKVDGPFGYAQWFQSLKSGRSFATNGPMLFLTVDGQEPGSTLPGAGPSVAKYRIRAEAQSIRPIDRLEIIHQGRVLHAVRRPDSRRAWAVDLQADLAVPGWVAARCFERAGRTVRFAHTSPVYIGEAKGPVPPEDVRFFLDWIDREIGFYTREGGFRSDADREEMLSFFRSAREVYAGLARQPGP